ncbi:MAG TPA: PmoA family protein [Bryobacteraceae bacterium]
MKRSLLACAAAVSFAAISPCPAAAQVSFRNFHGDHIAITVDGRPFSTFYIGSQYPKPFLAPLRTAGGTIVTRRYPMKMVPGESRDHPHHRGLFFGYGDINHVDLWANEPSEKVAHLARGKFAIEKLGKLKDGKKRGSFTTTIGWQDPVGHDILRESRIMTFYADPHVRKLDWDSTLTAIRQATFADTKEGFFAIRVADSMNGRHGGVLRNSKGALGEKNVWGKRADWATYEGTVDGRQVGIAILDNPHNYKHPPRWHARAYGLFAVNPFGEKQFDRDSATPGGYTMKPGQSLRFRYRVIIYTGKMPTSTVARWYREYTSGH